MSLDKLADDTLDIQDEQSYNNYVIFLDSFINSKETLIEVIKALKCKLNTDNLENFFRPLLSYINRYKLSQTLLFHTSHAFCDNDKCTLYTPSHLRYWIQNNSELFDTEIAFYARLIGLCGRLIKPDISCYDINEFNGEDIPILNSSGEISEQNTNEKLKIIASLVKHYDIISHT